MIRVHESAERRVLFGAGSLELVAGETKRLGAKRVLVLASGSQAAAAERLLADLGPRAVGELRGVQVHVPIELAEATRARARDLRADCLIAVGGGSATGLAKAVAATEQVRIVAVPTTYAGSEATTTWGITAGGRKQTARDDNVRPRVVVYDPELTMSLPPGTTAASGMNAIAHCIEALWGQQATALTDAYALEGVRLLSDALPGAVRDGADPIMRERVLAGAWLAGEAFAAGPGLHHVLCHVLGGTFNLPHAELHSALLPHTARFLLAREVAAEMRLRDALHASDAADALLALAEDIGAPTSLAGFGLSLDQLHAIAVSVADRPRSPTAADLFALLEAAADPHVRGRPVIRRPRHERPSPA